MFKKVIDSIKNNKEIAITFILSLILSLIFKGMFWVTLFIELGFIAKWYYQETERTKFNGREKGLFIGLMVALFVMLIYMFDDTTLIQLEETETKLTQIQEEYDNLQNENKELQNENKELQAKVDEASPWFEMKEEERKNVKQLAEEIIDRVDEVNNGEVKEVDNEMDIMELREYIREFWNIK